MDIKVITDEDVPLGTVYIGTPKDFGLVLEDRLVAKAHPATAVDVEAIEHIEKAKRRIGRIVGL